MSDGHRPGDQRNRLDAASGDIPPEIVTELVERYNGGQGLESLVEQYPHSYRKIRTTLITAGVTLRSPQTQLPATPPGLVNAYLDGRSIRKLADTFGMSYNQTRRILLAEGVELRRRGQQ